VTDRQTTPRRLRVVVVDADHRVRDSLSGLLGLGEELDVVGRAGHVAAALEVCAGASPDVLVVDPRLPDVDGGAALLAEIRRRHPGIVVLVLGWSGAGNEAGPDGVYADGFVSKSAAPSDLVERIVALAAAAGAGRHAGAA
jgi:DNA-binding NarL/FixJ family response regulator